MTFKEIVELINIIDKSQISFMELNYEKMYLKLDKSDSRSEYTSGVNLSNNHIKTVVEDTCDIYEKIDKCQKNSDVEEKENIELEDETSVDYILSPMVGTVYLAPAPDKSPYVTVGTTIKEGDVVCIIEAMKLMNEIESEQSGILLEVMVKNEQMVEYGQKLFKIKKS